MPEELDFDRDDPGERERGPDEPGDPDPKLQQMIDDALRLLEERENGPAEMVPVQQDCLVESEFQNLSDAIADKLREQPPKPDEKALPTIWSHGERSYSIDGETPTLVSNEQDNILQCFLDRNIALDTDALTSKSGTVNVAAAINRIIRQFGEAAIRRPKIKGEGYFIRVRSLKPTR